MAQPKKPTGGKTTPKKPVSGSGNSFPFLKYIWQLPQRYELLGLLGAFVVMEILFALFYPTPFTTTDTANYVQCAISGEFGGYRPIGYSWVLSFLHGISTKLGFVVFFQYWLHALAMIYFLFTFRYFFPPLRKWVWYLMGGLAVFNEALLYLTQWLMSDSVFISLSLIWFASALWLLHDPKKYFLLALHLFSLFLLIQIRYAGLVYPIISSLGFLWIHKPKKGWLLAAASMAIMVLVYFQNVQTHKRIFQINTFSGFGGWAQANNASIMLPHIDVDSNAIKDKELQAVNSIIQTFPDSIYTDEATITTLFMWDKGYPGKAVLRYVMQQHPTWGYVKSWVYTGTLLGKYGSHLMLKHPGAYTQHYVWLNAKQLFWPMMNYGAFPENTPDKNTKEWYKLNYDKFTVKKDVYYQYFEKLSLYKNVLVWVFFALALGIALVFRKKLGLSSWQQQVLWFVVIFNAIYILFLIIGHPIHYRYMVQIQTFFYMFLFIVYNQVAQKPTVTAE